MIRNRLLLSCVSLLNFFVYFREILAYLVLKDISTKGDVRMHLVQLIKDTIKIFVIFTACTLLFYFGLRMMNEEYEQIHRYDEPEGKAVKVFQWEEEQIIDRLSIFFRLGE